MRVSLVVSLISLMIPVQSPIATQPAITRDSLAVTSLQQAVTALGGQNAIGSLQNSVALGTLTPAPAVDSVSSWEEAGDFKWENDFSGSTYEFRQELHTNGVTKIYASGHGHPSFGNGDKILSRATEAAYASPPFHVPGILLSRQLANQNYSIQFVESTKLDGHAAVHIRTSVAGGPAENTLSPQDWFLDAVTGLPMRVVYRIPSNTNIYDYETDTTDFSNYKVVSGVAIPFTLTTSTNNIALCTATISSISFNLGISPADFDLNVGAAQ